MTAVSKLEMFLKKFVRRSRLEGKSGKKAANHLYLETNRFGNEKF
jgi:hypothetical protein